MKLGKFDILVLLVGFVGIVALIYAMPTPAVTLGVLAVTFCGLYLVLRYLGM